MNEMKKSNFGKVKRYANRAPMSMFLTKSLNGSFSRNTGKIALE